MPMASQQLLSLPITRLVSVAVNLALDRLSETTFGRLRFHSDGVTYLVPEKKPPISPARMAHLITLSRLSFRWFGISITAVVSSVSRSCFLNHRSEEHTSELQSREKLVCRLL